jgi:hypothetical protein
MSVTINGTTGITTVDLTASGDVSVTGTITASGDIDVSGAATGTITTDNDLSFDMSAGNNFKCTPTANGTLTFTNITSGQSGNIWLDNSGGYTISASSAVYMSASDVTTISTAGIYFMSYYSDGTNVAVAVTPAITSGGV